MDEFPPKTKLERKMAAEYRDYHLLILSTLDDLKADTKEILGKQHEQDKEIERLKMKSGMLGILGGIITIIGLKFSSMFFH